MQKLTIKGGPRAVNHGFKLYNTMGKEEERAAVKVIRSGVLSRFIGAWDKDFFGGEYVQSFEKKFAAAFGVKHAVSVNSATSGLVAAIGACGVGPGDEVIVSPYTMSASATAIVAYHAVPVFADIEDRTFNLDPAAVEKKVTPRTKAIMVPNIFGHPADFDALKRIARKHNLYIIEDNAQSPTAKYRGRYAGTIGDIGVFSLNYHKHIHTGEGGVCLTNDKALATKMQLIRNHAESVVKAAGVNDLSNMVGFNFRMGEIEAAIGIEQLKKMNRLVASRVRIANQLTKHLAGIDGLVTPAVRKDCTNVYYVYTMKYTGRAPHRDAVVKALVAEGVPIDSGYLPPLYMLPMYQRQIAYGDKGCPFKCPSYKGKVNYAKGLCPVAERMEEQEVMMIEVCRYDFTDKDIRDISNAFHKVFANLNQLF
jgi:dTDP-4-amino-4,6-dideoxygalactose transaminase